MARSLEILVMGLLCVGGGTTAIPRMTPPGGLVGLDYLLMGALAVFAFFAGRHWYNRSVFLAYGGLGMFTFIPGYLADGRLGLKFAYGHATLWGEYLWRVAGVLFIAIICDVAGRIASEEQTTATRSQAHTGDENQSATDD